MTITIKSETAIVNFEEYIGDTVVMEFGFFSDRNQTQPVDLSDYSFLFEVKLQDTIVLSYTDADSEFTKIPYTATTETGTTTVALSVTIPNTITATKEAGSYPYSIVGTSPSGHVNTYVLGRLILQERKA